MIPQTAGLTAIAATEAAGPVADLRRWPGARRGRGEQVRALLRPAGRPDAGAPARHSHAGAWEREGERERPGAALWLPRGRRGASAGAPASSRPTGRGSARPTLPGIRVGARRRWSLVEASAGRARTSASGPPSQASVDWQPAPGILYAWIRRTQFPPRKPPERPRDAQASGFAPALERRSLRKKEET